MSDKLIRLVHPTDPNASADGYARHKEGGILAPEADLPTLATHGFVPEPIEDKGIRAHEYAERQERRKQAAVLREALGPAA